MAIFGGGVRPELGRTDYGAVARGSEIAAQLSAQGSQMMAGGLAKALEGAGAAIRGYQDRKQEKQFTEQTLTNLGNFLKDNPNALSEFGFDIDIEDKGALKAAVQGFGGGNFKAGAAIITPLLAQSMQQKKQNALKESLMESQIASAETSNRLVSLQADALKAKQNDQSALSQALEANTPAGGGPINEDDVRKDYLELGGQDLKLVNDLFPKTEVAPNITAVPNPVTGENVGVLRTGPSSFSQVPGLPIPAAIQEITARAELGKEIPKLLRAGKDDDAIAIAVALGIRNTFGATDGIYLRSQYGIKEEEETQDDVAKARAILEKNK